MVSKLLLKSRINYVDFPPLSEAEKFPVITQMEPIYKDSAVLSRNVRDAEKVLNTKRRKLKDAGKPIEDLEKLDLELEELKKQGL